MIYFLIYRNVTSQHTHLQTFRTLKEYREFCKAMGNQIDKIRYAPIHTLGDLNLTELAKGKLAPELASAPVVEAYPTMCEVLDTITNLDDLLEEVEGDIATAYDTASEEIAEDAEGNASEVLENMAGMIGRLQYTVKSGLPSAKCGTCCGCAAEEEIEQ